MYWLTSLLKMCSSLIIFFQDQPDGDHQGSAGKSPAASKVHNSEQAWALQDFKINTVLYLKIFKNKQKSTPIHNDRSPKQ